MGVPDNERHRWLRAVWLHDALRDASAEELERWASSVPGPASLKHGPAAAARAKAEGELDRGVLDAVRYHSVGLAEWDMLLGGIAGAEMAMRDVGIKVTPGSGVGAAEEYWRSTATPLEKRDVPARAPDAQQAEPAPRATAAAAR